MAKRIQQGSSNFHSTWSIVLTLIFSHIVCVASHARLMEPPSRSSMWRYGFPTPTNYDDDGLYCGGISRQWKNNGGKCGLCGDPWNSPKPRPNEAGGTFGKGIISRVYKPGQIIEAAIHITANHQGHFEFRLCPNNNPKKEASQECLDKYLLRGAENNKTKLSAAKYGRGKAHIKLRLPQGVDCTQCVFQWTYIAGNNWGTCKDGSRGLGCGPQETFRACSDIAIGHGDPKVNTRFKRVRVPAFNDIEYKPFWKLTKYYEYMMPGFPRPRSESRLSFSLLAPAAALVRGNDSDSSSSSSNEIKFGTRITSIASSLKNPG